MSAEGALHGEPPNAGVLRRFGAMIYDCLPVLALLIVATFAFVPFLHGKVLVPREVGALAYVYWLVQLALTAAFFVFFWTRKGQTIGMLAWRLRLQRPDGSLLDWRVALARLAIIFALLLPFLAGYWLIWRDWPDRHARTLAICVSLAPIVLSYLWIWIDRDRLAWHDRWTKTRVVMLPKKKK